MSLLQSTLKIRMSLWQAWRWAPWIALGRTCWSKVICWPLVIAPSGSPRACEGRVFLGSLWPWLSMVLTKTWPFLHNTGSVLCGQSLLWSCQWADQAPPRAAFQSDAFSCHSSLLPSSSHRYQTSIIAWSLSYLLLFLLLSICLSHYLQQMFAHLTSILASEFWKTQLAWSPNPTSLKQPLSLLRKLFLSRNFHMYKPLWAF